MREYAPSDGTGFASWRIASELHTGHFFTRDIEGFWAGRIKEIRIERSAECQKLMFFKVKSLEFSMVNSFNKMKKEFSIKKFLKILAIILAIPFTIFFIIPRILGYLFGPLSEEAQATISQLIVLSTAAILGFLFAMKVKKNNKR
jgi:uncharacterized protein YqhQ